MPMNNESERENYCLYCCEIFEYGRPRKLSSIIDKLDQISCVGVREIFSGWRMKSSTNYCTCQSHENIFEFCLLFSYFIYRYYNTLWTYGFMRSIVIWKYLIMYLKEGQNHTMQPPLKLYLSHYLIKEDISISSHFSLSFSRIYDKYLKLWKFNISRFAYENLYLKYFISKFSKIQLPNYLLKIGNSKGKLT